MAISVGRGLRQLAAVALLTLPAMPGKAQVAAYPFSQSSGTYVPVSAGGTLVALSTGPATTYDTDGWNISLPFTFTFNGVGYNSIFANSNGGATFGTTTSTSASLISATAGYSGAIAAMNRDLWAVYGTTGTRASGSTTITAVGSFVGIDVGDTLTGTGIPAGTTVVSFNQAAGTIQMSAASTSAQNGTSVRWPLGSVWTETLGAAPNRTFVIEWRQFSDVSTTVPNNTAFSFQIRLQETSNIVRVMYGPFATSSTTSRTNQVGLRGATNADFNNRTATVAAGGFNSTSGGTSNTATVARTAASFPASGLTFSWTPATCFFPLAVTVSALTTTTGTVSWTAPAIAPSGGYEYEVRTSGAPGSGTTGLAQSGSTAAGVLTTNLTGLTQATSYSVYVRGNCGATTSNWTLATNFITPCNAVATFPYVEPFNSPDGGLPSCWTRQLVTGSDNWAVHLTANGGSGDITASQSGAGFVGKTYNTSTAILYSPPFNLSGFGTNQARINMWVYRHDATAATDSVQFLINTGTSTAGATQLLVIRPLRTLAPVVATEGWYNYTATIPTTFNTTTPAYIIVRGVTLSGGSSYDLGMDSFRLEQVPSCLPPTVTATTNITTSGATINWTASGSNPINGYEWEIRTSGAGGSGSTGLAQFGSALTSATSANVAGLTAATAYSVYVRAACGTPGGFSTWSGPIAFTTQCNAVATFPYVEPFNSPDGGLPACWSQQLVTGANNWAVYLTANFGSGDITASQSGAGFVAKPYNTSTAVLYSPPFNLSGFGTSQARINMWVYRHDFAAATDSVQFLINTSASTTGATELLVIRPLTTLAPVVPVEGWYNYTATIPATFNTTTPIHIIVRGVTLSGFSSYDLGMDSFRLEQAPTCFPPTGVAVSGTTTTGTTINWTAPTAGVPATYNWEVRTSGAPGSGATGLATNGTVTVPATTANATGLAPNTTYTIYVQSNCGGGDFSAWSTAVIFTTPCVAFTAPFYQGFAGGTLPSCWVNSNPANNTAANALWKFSGAPGYGTTANGRPNGTFAWVDASTPYVTNVTLTSPLVNLSTVTNPILEFEWYKNNNQAPAGFINNNLKVEGNPGNTGWVTLFDDTSNAAAWRTVSMLLPPAFANTTAQFRFVVDKTLSNDFYDDVLLDSVRIIQCSLPTVAFGADTTLCGAGAALTLDAGPGTSYAWSTGATTQTINISTAGTYSVTVVSGSANCAKSDTINVLTGAIPTVALGPDTAVCGNVLSFPLNAGNPGSNYAWSSPAANLTVFTTQVIDLGPIINASNSANAGSTPIITPVYASVTNASGCVGRDTVNVSVTPTARVSDFTISGTDPAFTFTPVLDSFTTTYMWNFGDGTTGTGNPATHTYNTNGSYTVTLMVGNQCGVTDTVIKTRQVTAGVKGATLDGATITLYPNPTAADAVLAVEGSAKLRGYQVLNAAGALIADRRLDGVTRTTLNTASFAPGIYTLRIQLDKGVVVRKLEVIK